MRTALPHRRQNETREIEFDGKPYTVCVGCNDSNEPREVFCDGQKYGSAMQAFIADACIIISIALQHGITRDELAHSLGSVPAFHGGKEVETHASPIGMIVAALEAQT